jgi:hypothetical protein
MLHAGLCLAGSASLKDRCSCVRRRPCAGLFLMFEARVLKFDDENCASSTFLGVRSTWPSLAYLLTGPIILEDWDRIRTTEPKIGERFHFTPSVRSHRIKYGSEYH